jgi:dTDP-4-amino-4,6-dideoxygalactose transaminase
MIPIFAPQFGREELAQVKEVLDSGMLACGKKSVELEEKFANYVGCKYAIGVNSCTSALFLAYTTLNKNRLVYIPSVTFVSVANMAVHAGLHVEFNDMIPVGFGYRIGNTKIWDCAHELYRKCFDTITGGGNDVIACFSFYPTKNLGSAEGGMICTNNKSLAKYFKLMRSHGMERVGYDWDYKVEKAGWKLAMNDIQAGIALAKLNKLDHELAMRQKVVEWYNEELGKKVRGYHIYPIMVKDRDKLMKEMKKAEIGYTVNFKPIHLHPAYRNWSIDRRLLTESEKWGTHELSLPLYPTLTKKDVHTICQMVRKYIL